MKNTAAAAGGAGASTQTGDFSGEKDGSPASNASGSTGGGVSPGNPTNKKRGRVAKAEGGGKNDAGQQGGLLSKKETLAPSQDSTTALSQQSVKAEAHRSMPKAKSELQTLKLNGGAVDARAASGAAATELSSSSSSSEDEAPAPPSKKGKKTVVGGSAKLLGSPQMNRQMPPSLAAVSGNNSDASFDSSDAE